jgi:hypothetical protein
MWKLTQAMINFASLEQRTALTRLYSMFNRKPEFLSGKTLFSFIHSASVLPDAGGRLGCSSVTSCGYARI